MTATRDVVRGGFVPLQVKTYGQIPNVLEIPSLIKIQLDSFDWFKREGLKELLSEISPIQDFTGSKMDLVFGDYEWDEEKARANANAHRRQNEAATERCNSQDQAARSKVCHEVQVPLGVYLGV